MAEGWDDGSPKRYWYRERQTSSEWNSESVWNETLPVVPCGRSRVGKSKTVSSNSSGNDERETIPTQVFFSRTRSHYQDYGTGRLKVLVSNFGLWEVVKKVKQHYLYLHLSAVLREQELPISNEALFNEERYKVLKPLAEYILGGTGTPDALIDMLNWQEQFPDPRKTQITPVCEKGMKSLCTYKGWEIPSQFKVAPLNQPCF